MHNIIKKITASAIVAIMIVFTGCTQFLPRTALLNSASDEEIAEDRFNKILSALEGRNCSALENMFSEEVNETSPDLRKDIKALTEYYRGSVIAYEHDLAGVHESTADGETVTEVRCSAIMDTDIDGDVKKYYLSFVEKVSTRDEENGLYHLELKDSYSRYYLSDETAGAVIPSMFTAENYLDGILTTFKGDMGSKLLELFARDVKDEIDISDKANEMIDYVDGSIDSYNELETVIEKDGDFIITKGYYELVQGIQGEKTYLIYFVHKYNDAEPLATGMYTIKIAEKTSGNMELDISNDELGIIIEQTALE